VHEEGGLRAWSAVQESWHGPPLVGSVVGCVHQRGQPTSQLPASGLVPGWDFLVDVERWIVAKLPDSLHGGHASLARAVTFSRVRYRLFVRCNERPSPLVHLCLCRCRTQVQSPPPTPLSQVGLSGAHWRIASRTRRSSRRRRLQCAAPLHSVLILIGVACGRRR